MVYKIIFSIKYFLRSKEAIRKFISELNLAYFVLIFYLIITFHGNFFLIKIVNVKFLIILI